MPLAITPEPAGGLLARATTPDGRVFSIQEGLSNELINQLRAYSLDQTDTELARTSDYQRFGEESFARWYASKERTLYALVAEDGTLAALTWFGPKPFGRKSMKHLSEDERAQNELLMDTDGWHTIVYRSYASFRGTGLMTDFVRFAMETYKKKYPKAKFWAGIFLDNPGSVRLAEKLGFKVARQEGNETLLIKE